MGADWPDEADEPSGERSNPRTAKPVAVGPSPPRPAAARRYADQYEAVSAQQSATARPDAAEEQAAAEKWDKSAEESRWMWGEYQRKWPPSERPPVDTSADPPGSWRGDRDRYLDRAANDRVEAACDRIADREREKISPAMRAVENQDPDRHLIGFDYRLKGRDRIKEKVCDVMEELNFPPEEAVSLVPDAIRYTVQYREAKYTQGVYADIERMKGRRASSCTDSRTHGPANSTRASTASGSSRSTDQRFEVQFHTRDQLRGQATHARRIRAAPHSTGR